MSTETLLVGLAILSSSFWGSWHCAAMCGPIASLMAKKNALHLYQVGRGVSYVAIGLVGGYLGSMFLNHEFGWLRVSSGIMFALILIGMGIQTYRGQKVYGALNISWVHEVFSKKKNGFLLGLLSVFLPCAWLYTYVLAAVATRSPLSGGLTMLLFWLGSLPAMNALSLFMKKSIQLAPRRKRVVAGSLLVVAGLYSLMSFYFFEHTFH